MIRWLKARSEQRRAGAAAQLGVKPREVQRVKRTAAGLVITTTDGVRYVIVPEHRPDRRGRHGVMFLEAPDKEPAGWALPTYEPPTLW